MDGIATMEKTVEGSGFICMDYIQSEKGVICDVGGTCANVLSILSFLGWKSSLWMPSYADDSLSSNLVSRGIHLEYFIKTRKRLPCVVQINDKKSREHHFITKCPMCGSRLAETLLPNKKQVEKWNDDSSLFFCDRISEGILERARNITESNGITMYEPNGFRTYNQLLDSCKKFHVIKFSDEKVPYKIQQNLLNALRYENTQLIIVTQGEKGTRFAVKPEWKWVEVRNNTSIKIEDSSGAGDWLTAVFLNYIIPEIRRGELEFGRDRVSEGLRLAMKAAELSCSQIGAQGIMHNRTCIHELERIVEEPLSSSIPYCKSYENVMCSHCGKYMF